MLSLDGVAPELQAFGKLEVAYDFENLKRKRNRYVSSMSDNAGE